jgi:hypothetical protein
MGKFVDLTGQRFGRWVVIGRYPGNSKQNRVQWACKCDCGYRRAVTGDSLVSGKSQSCGCYRRDMTSAKNTIDLSGEKYGRLLVIGKDDKKPYWLCQCDCGNLTRVFSGNLRSGKILSCGCYQREIRITHGDTEGGNTPEYSAWRAMKSRCLNEKNPGFSRYGGRGITICDRWVGNYENFLKDMGRRPPNTSIDRIKNNEGYSPENCRWTTPDVQSRNTSYNVWIKHGGEEMIQKDWMERLGIPLGAWSYRKRKFRGSAEKTLEYFIKA